MFRLTSVAVRTLNVGFSSRVIPCMHVNPLLRSFHSSSPLFEENPSTETKATETPAGSEAKTDAPKTVEEQLADVKKQLEKSMKDLKDLQDKNLRLLAEMENVRNIAKRDIKNERMYSIQSFGKSLLCVCDYLNLAIASVPQTELEGESANKTLVSLHQGVVMTQKELDKVLGTQGIKRFGELGEAFNPNIHEAMFQMPLAEGKEPNTLGQIITAGYMFKERVLRPCKAGVYMKKE